MCDKCPADWRDGSDPWPICTAPGCDEEVPPPRFHHIEPRCFAHSSWLVRTVHIIDMPKSNPLVTSSLSVAKGIGASHKGNRQVF